LKLGLRNYFSERVKDLVLGHSVSKIIMSAATEAFKDDLIEF